MTDTHRAIDAVWRIESAKLIAALTRITRDVGVAEDLAQEALLAALEQWPAAGIPDKPAAWLMAAAKNKAIDLRRRSARIDTKHAMIEHELLAKQLETSHELDDAIDDFVGDDLLRLIFMACHPVLSSDSRVALTLRLLGGLTTDEIARAFLVPEPTIAQRIVRAKRTLADARVDFELPRPQEMDERLGAVLQVIYLIFNEGYSATAGDDWMRPTLLDEALRLGRILAGLAVDEPEVFGLLALMELQASRQAARTSATGDAVLLLEQDRSRWDYLAIGRGLTALDDAVRLGGMHMPYTLQAAIAACHARAREAHATDWARIASLYEQLAAVNPSPVVELNRAVAVSMAHGPAPALELVDKLADVKSLRDYHLLPAVRGDLLDKLGRKDEARTEFERAASLTRNERERAVMLARAARLG